MATTLRQGLVEQLFPGGIPQLWCPPLTHFQADGRLDRERMAAHLRHLGRHARGWLIPGSTGEGWQLADDEIRQVLDHALHVASDLDARLLIGVLRRDTESMIACIRELTDWICRRADQSNPLEAFCSQNVCGFTVCPPTGAGLSVDQLRTALQAVLELSLPTALYQLPQVTQNELPPELVEELADQYPNFYLFKDTSGEDRVARSNAELGDLFLVRGAEGHYAQWLKLAGGPYDGFLLSTANGFAPELAQMISLVQEGHITEARQTIAAVEQAVDAIFELVGSVPQGNPFTNANKAIDYWMAFGSSAHSAPAPFLHGGHQLPREVLAATRRILEQAELLPQHGYWQDNSHAADG